MLTGAACALTWVRREGHLSDAVAEEDKLGRDAHFSHSLIF